MFIDTEKKINTFKIESKGGSGVKNHNLLQNLDYEHSGHTGFASSNDLSSAVTLLEGKISKAGHKIEVTFLNQVLTVVLKDKDNSIISSGNVTLPDADKYMTGASYYNGIITFTYNEGNPTTVDISPLINGLASELYVDTQVGLVNTALTNHVNNTNNPHSVTKSQVGLGSVVNTSDSDVPQQNGTQKFTTGGAYNLKDSIDNHIADTNNPHSVTKAQVGLGDVVNTSDSDTPTSGGTQKFTTGGAYTLKDNIDTHKADTNNPHSVTKAQVGLGNVDNTSDLDKPISTATQNALNNKQDKKPNGTDDLISNGKVSTVYLPDNILGQLLYGGLVDVSTVTATLSTNAKSKLGTTANTITLTNDTTPITGYVANEGIYYVVNVAGTFGGIVFSIGDWLISTGNSWEKVDNTDEVTSVNGRTGAVTVQEVIDSNNMLDADLVDDTTSAHKFVSSSDKTDIASNTAARHTHSNKALLDTYAQTETDLADAVAKKHSHSNKALLDTYSQTESDLADAVAKKHSHSNKATLDLIEQPYTTAEQTKLSGVESGAQVNVIEGVQVNGADLTPDANKKVNVTTPTKTSDLNNDSGFTTQTYVDTELAKKQNTIDSSHKLSADLVDDTTTTNKFVTSGEKTDIANNTTDRHNHFYLDGYRVDSGNNLTTRGDLVGVLKNYLYGKGTLAVGSMVTFNEVYTNLKKVQRVDGYVTEFYTSGGQDYARINVVGVTILEYVAYSGSYNDLDNKPTIPTKTSDLNNDSGFIANPMTTQDDIIIGGASGTPTRLAKGTEGQVLKVGSGGLEWANDEAGSNDYDDLTDKPQINGVTLSGDKSTADLNIYARVKYNENGLLTPTALQPNEYYKYIIQSSIGSTRTITLEPEIANILNEYMFEVVCDGYAGIINTPADIVWKEIDEVTINSSNTITLQDNYTYQFSIVNKRGLIVAFANATLDDPVLSWSGNTLTWGAITGAENYKVYVGSTLQATITTTSYDESSELQTIGTLGTPTNISVTRGTDNTTANITWTKPSNAVWFTIKCYQHGTSTLVKSTATSSNSASITGLDVGTEYDFTVLAQGVTASKTFKVQACSDHAVDSNEVSITKTYTTYNASAESSVVSYTTPYGITKSAGNGTLAGATYIYPNTSENFTLTPSTYYELPSSITVTNATLDSYDNSTGAITISNPTGNVTISATCVRITYTVTTNLTNLTSDNDGSINAGGTKNITLTANSGYELPSSITVTGATYTYNNTTGVIALSSPTGNVTIDATGTLSNYTITMSLTDLTSDYDGTTMTINDTKTITLTADAGFDLPSSISVVGASYTYDSTTGEIVLSNPTGNITITANGDSGGE